MRLRVLYFAAVRDLVAKDEESIDVGPEVRTVRDLVAWLSARDPALGARMAHVRIARNEAFAKDDDALAEGDVIALIPPVAGG